jgi:hypothetical protein
MPFDNPLLAKLFGALSFQQELNGVLEAGQAFLPSLALSVRTGNFQTRRQKTAFVRLTAMQDGCEFFHEPIDNPFCRKRERLI